MINPAKIVEGLLDDEPMEDPKDFINDITAEKESEIGHSWRFYRYDVWGNAEDGYEVNDVYKTSDVIQIPESAQGTDASLFNHLDSIGFLNNCEAALFDTDGDEHTIYLNYKDKPIGELRREDDDEA